MSTGYQNEKKLFNAALDLKTPGERAAYLDKVCGSDLVMKARIMALLKAHEGKDDLLDLLIDNSRISPGDEDLKEGPGTVIGRYKLLEKIGEGGMAVVYMAEQQEGTPNAINRVWEPEPIRRKVALKIIKLGMDTRQVIARFEAERQALAMMDHPHIAKVLDAGATETGRPYFVMELVTGVSITEYCDKNNLSTKERLDLFIQVCNAVQHAHQKGIIHRDIKPSNVMVTHHDGRPIPKVIDFGIAKATNQRLTEKTLFTRYAHIIGTPAYMSPEQAEMSDVDVDTRSDIYSLGVLLYELLTGTTPFSEEELRKAGYIEMQRVIREQEPAKPSTKLSTLGETLTDVAKHRGCTPDLLRKAVRGDLDWIVMKSLEKGRTRRYETANSLATDIERHLNNELVMARPPSTVYRFRKLVRRNKGVFAGAAVVASVLVLGVIVSSWQAVRATQAKRAESRLREQAEARELTMRRLAYTSDMSLAQQALAMNDLGRTRRLLEAHRPAPGEVDLRDWEWRYLWQECRSDALGELCRYPNPAYSVAYSPDGSMLAVAQRSGEFVEIWDVSGRRRIRTLPMAGRGRFVTFSPRGDLVAAASGNQILLWQTGTWNLVRQLILDDVAHAPKFSLDGRRLACMSYLNEAVVWEVGPWTVVRRIGGVRPLHGHLGAVDFSPDGQVLAIGDTDRRLQAIDLASGNTKFDVPEAHPEPITAVAWSPDGSIIASGSGYAEGAIRLWDAVSGAPLGTLEGHTVWVSELIFSADSKRLYSASADQTIRIWEVKQRRCVTVLRGSCDEVYGLALSPDGATLASACKDGVIAFWNAHPRPNQEQPRLIPLGRLGRPAFAPNGREFAVPRRGMVSRFDLATSEEIEQLPALGDDVVMVAYSPDATLLVSGGQSGKICVWSCAEHRLLRELDASGAPIRWLGFRADGTRLLSVDARGVDNGSGAKGQAIWWDTVAWQAVQTFTLDPAILQTAAISPDGHLLALGVGMGGVRWLNAETGELLGESSTGHRRSEEGIAFSRDGTHAVSVAADGSVAVWDPSSLQPIAVFKGHMMGAHAVAFSPDGRRFATGGSSRDAVKLWDVSSLREVMTLPGQGAMFSFVAFSPDGCWLAACSEMNGQLHLWRAPSWEEIEADEKIPAQGGATSSIMAPLRPGGFGESDIRQAPIIPVVDSNGDGKVQGKEE